MHVVATAGHVDHGKSTLVHALTNIDPDRWTEEKRRGLTIDLGFAWCTLPSGRGVAFVDVPGHVRFLKNMLAGVGAVDACVFVVAANEGWKPQSEEHLRILEQLGVSHGLIALTKVGLVDDDEAEIARLDVMDRVAGTFLEGAEIAAVDSPQRVGVATLRLALDRMLEATPTAIDRDRPRLWIDRAFAMAGAGTVVTGTLAGGALHVDDELVVTSVHGDGQRQVRVRGLESLGTSVDAIGPGNRVAVSLGGVAHDQVRRGDALVRGAQWHTTRMFDASLGALNRLDHDVSERGAYVAYIGSGEHPVRLRVLGPTPPGGEQRRIAPGTEGLVRLHLPHPVPVVPGDRYILRETGRGETVGGGEVLDVDPILPARKARPDRSPGRVVAERGWIEADELARLTGERPAPTIGRWLVAPRALAKLTSELTRRVAEAGPLGLDLAQLNERERLVLESLNGITISGGRAVPAGADDPLARHPYLAALESHPFRPPAPDELAVDRRELRELVRRALVVEEDGIFFAPSALAEAARTVARLLRDQPTGVTVADVRKALDTTRKWALPLLNQLDRQGVTRRRGDVRVAGPRLPEAD